MKMSNKKSYNGWTNYETWLIRLWIDNDPELYLMVREWVTATQSKSATELGEMLKQFLLENKPTEEGKVYDDLLYSAIRKANFREVGEHLMEDF